MFEGYRSSDAVVTICQDNDRKAIEIYELNKEAETALGYKTAEVAGSPLMNYLPDRILKLLTEYVEYVADGNDVGDVLSKVQSFCIKDSTDKEKAYRLKVLRSESIDKNAYFRLILQDKAGIRKNEAFREMLQDNFKGHEVIDPETELPDRNSIAKDVELVHFYVNKEALRACFAVLEIDHVDKLIRKNGQSACAEALKCIAHIAKQNLRSDDTIGRVAENRLGLLLMDTNHESARMVLNRLRWLVAANPCVIDKKDYPATVSIAFCQIGDHSKEKDLVNLAEACLKIHHDPKGNVLIDIPE